MASIITDQSALRQISQPATIENGVLNEEGLRVVKELLTSIPNNGVGLAAPQISEFQRIFLARLSTGHFIFVNPSLSNASNRTSPSVEGCLSIPDVTWCVNRHHSINIHAELVFAITDDEISDTIRDMTMRVHGRDAYIVQHEYDHLEGILMIDHPRTETVDEKLVRKYEDRRQRIAKNRMEKKMRENQKRQRIERQKMNPKKYAKLKKMAKAARRQEKKRVEIQERFRAEQEGLFLDNTK